jgi:hypothetical protein
MRAYPNGFWLFNTDPTRVAGILTRDARADGCCQFIIETIYAACNNKGKEAELAALCGKFKKPLTKTAKEIELDEVLLEDFTW